MKYSTIPVFVFLLVVLAVCPPSINAQILTPAETEVFPETVSEDIKVPSPTTGNVGQPLDSNEKKRALTLGILQGGGSLIGIDLELLLTRKIGIQFGGGFFGYGIGVNYHLEPRVNSSFFSLSYWHQGLLNTYAQSVLGPTFVFRAKKIFTAQLGFGYVIELGPAMEGWFESKGKKIKDYPPVILLYSIGIYIPLSKSQ